MDEFSQQATVRILVLNPNSSTDMTLGVENAIHSIGLPKFFQLSTYTAPKDSPASINDGGDLRKSTEVVLATFDVEHAARSYDAILVACFSVHPLVTELTKRLAGTKVTVTGIFEASVVTALMLLPAYPFGAGMPGKTWGIVTTGKFWEQHLMDGAAAYLGQQQGGPKSSKFTGVYSTGLDAGDFHGGVSPKVIRAKLKEATKSLLSSSNVGCVVMGCAGMAGLEAIIRDVAQEEYGVEAGNQVFIVDGVKAGVGLLDQAVKNARLFQE
ncbi:Protein dcg1 [Sporothrix eucalyptigena]|uniref:Protein dcg1 n=1 Tax=Sporothrix eucalyptigena TaxID=1812306 RepID=A0ABP0CPU4_9PEZI